VQELNFAVAAQINGKEIPNKLYVHGSVLVYTEFDKVEVREAESPSINPRLLLLDVVVKRVQAPMKGRTAPFLFEKEVDGREVDQVTVRFEDDTSTTVTVSYLG
jgi:hypothetical protein